MRSGLVSEGASSGLPSNGKALGFGQGPLKGFNNKCCYHIEYRDLDNSNRAGRVSLDVHR